MSGTAFARRLSPKVDAFATMYEHERETYEAWLGSPDAILSLLRQHFVPEWRRIRWGKLLMVGRKPSTDPRR